MKSLFLVFFSLCFLACTDTTSLETEIEQLKTQLNETQTKLDEAVAAADAPDAPGLIHSVFFWLNEGISEEDEAAYLEGVKSLKAISSIKDCYIGPAAPTEERGVVDNSYSYALIVHFDDVAGHDAYQIDPIHLKFVEDHKDKWTKVVVYDNEMLAE